MIAKRTRTLEVCLVAAVLGLFSVGGGGAAPHKQTWVASPSQVSGYAVYIGQNSGSYTQRIDVGSALTYSFNGAVAGQRYCFAVAAISSIEGPKSSEVCGFSNAPPTLQNPGNQSSTVGQQVTLQLVGSDPASQPLTYSASGLPPGLSVQGSTGFISGTGTTAGSFAVTARAFDGALTTSQSFTWTMSTSTSGADTTAPTITITGPTNGDTYTSPASSMALSGTASDNRGVSQVTWVNDRGGNGVASGTTSWSVPSVALQTGTNKITVQARDAAGNVNVDVLTVTYSGSSTGGATGGTSGPLQLVGVTTNMPSPQPAGTAITFTAAASGQGPYEFHWTLFDGVNWMMVQNWTTSPSFTWRPTVAGTAYRMTARVRTVGTTTEVLGSFVPFTVTTATAPIDTTPPTVTITGPTSGTTFSTTSSSIALSGTASDNRGVSQVTWGNDRGGSGVANGTTGWTVPSISLQSGTNVITVQARDAAGNASPDVLTVIYSPPTTGGSGGGSPSSPLQIVSVTTNVPSPQPVGSVITFTAAASGGTGSYEYHWTLFDGVNWNLVQNWTTSPSYLWRPTVASTAYQMVLRVRNRGDAASEVQGGFVRFTITSASTGGSTGGTGGGTGTGDTRRPQVDITGPSNGTDYTSWSSTLTMSGTAADNVGVTQVTWSNDRGGSGVASGTTNWQASIPLQRGDNVITITARDAAGNVATDVQNVLRP